VKGFYIIIITAAVMGWLASQARTAKARQHGDTVLFPPVRVLQAIFCAVFVMGAVFVVCGYLSPLSDRTIGIWIGLLFIAFSVLAWPKAVYVSKSGVKQRAWWGGWRTLAWPDLAEAKKQRDGSMVLRGNGVKIVFTQYHADRELFLKEIEKNASGALILN
jgi:putative Ca2+/H+ antiporter (TMEM165/GDT1 family)